MKKVTMKQLLLLKVTKVSVYLKKNLIKLLLLNLLKVMYEIPTGAVAIAAITSCTNTSNPYVMLAAGLSC